MSQELATIETDEKVINCGRGYTISSIKMHEANRHLPGHNWHCHLDNTEFNYNVTKNNEPACKLCSVKLDEYSFYIFTQYYEEYKRGIYYITCSATCPGLVNKGNLTFITADCIKCGTKYIHSRYDNTVCPDCKLKQNVTNYCARYMPGLIADYGDEIPHELLPNIIAYYIPLDLTDYFI